MEEIEILEQLHPLERQILPFLKDVSELNELIIVSKLKDVEVMRALQWLSNKGVLELNERTNEVVKLSENGIKYAKIGLPERRFLEALNKGAKNISDVESEGIDKAEINICIGTLKKKMAINVLPQMNFEITNEGKKLIEKKSLEELFLESLIEGNRDTNSLTPEEQYAMNNLISRKSIITKEIIKDKKIILTQLGKKIITYDMSKFDKIDKLTKEVIVSEIWKNKGFRKFDTNINVPEIYPAKKQVYRKFLDDVKDKFVSLGFEEMEGPLVENDLMDMDALFMPQFHSARDIHEAYYIKKPKQLKVDEEILKRVKDAHENGGDTGSIGWQYKFDIDKAKNTLLRTQGTACSARMLASKELKIPGKYFGIQRCFRYDVIDATHLPDFNQVEGIVVGENLNLQHLFGLLRMFATEIAKAEEIKLVPGYFPFTEPSVELFAKHPTLGWVELGGAGIFRPEVTKTLTGKNISVIAWGLGVDRLGMFKLGIKDIRNLFSQDIDFLRKNKITAVEK